MTIAITGSSGMIGTALTAALRADGHRVLRMVRRAPSGPDEVAWDPRAPDGGLSPQALAGVDAVVHLAGPGVLDRRWTQRYMAHVRDSRVLGTRALVTGLTGMSGPPPVLLAASGIHWYGDTGGREVDESAPNGTGFLAGVVRDWEAATTPAAEAGIRVVNLRAGVVLSPRGGMMARMLLPFRLGLGARLGTGRQVMSWITMADYTRIMAFLLAHPEISGPVNLTTPNPVTNAEFTAALAAALHRPAVLALPTQALALALGKGALEILASSRVLPSRLLAAGYSYQHPVLREALAAVLAPPPA